jgi:pimeloyl-ACP methyl ester carboxylesterase
MADIEINGLRITHQDCLSTGRPLVLVHGFTGNRLDFQDHFDALCALGRTVAYDHRGHGESSNAGRAEAYSFANLVDDLHRLLRVLDLDRVDLLGHSMGGMIALRYTLAYPEDVASLILMDTSARAPDGFDRSIFEAGGLLAQTAGMESLAEIAKSMAREDPRRPAASIAYERRIGSDEYWARHRRRLMAMDPFAFGALGTELCDQEPLTDRLGAIECPTTILVGDQDAPFLEPSSEMAAAIPGSRKVVIPAAAHSPQLENPSAWFASMRDHLAWVRS